MTTSRSCSLALAASLLVGCAAFQNLGEARTPAQQFYMAQGLYVLVAQYVVHYVESPEADPELVKVLQRIDQEAYLSLEVGRAALAEPTGQQRDVYLTLAAKTVERIVERMLAALRTAEAPVPPIEGGQVSWDRGSRSYSS